MAAANNKATPIKSDFFHPEHLLAKYNYSKASKFTCAACELTVTGSGLSSDECNFNIHEDCFAAPGSITVPQHPHKLTLRRLGASRWCDVCRVTSHEGRYMYRCVACDYDVHPRCRSIQVRPQHTVQHHNGSTREAIKVGLKIAKFALQVADLLTGGTISPIVDAISDMCDD